MKESIIVIDIMTIIGMVHGEDTVTTGVAREMVKAEAMVKATAEVTEEAKAMETEEVMEEVMEGVKAEETRD
jgi:hypothetical protein